MGFIKSHWVYIFIGFALVVVVALGYLTITRLQQLNTPSDTSPETVSTPTSENSAEISFTLEQLTPTVGISGEEPTCLSLTATPTSGTTPATISFAGEGGGTSGQTINYHFSFGDQTDQSIEQLLSTDTAEQTISHTYTEPGNYRVTLTLSNASGQQSNTCETQIAIGGVRTTEPSESGNETGGPELAQASSPTPTPTVRPSATPTRTPTATRTPTPTGEVFPTTAPDESIPVPDVPQAGGFAPTVAAGIGGIVIILLAIFL